jgi:hypothetical protein
MYVAVIAVILRLVPVIEDLMYGWIIDLNPARVGGF